MTEQQPLDRQSGRGFVDNPRASHRRALAFGSGLSGAVHLLVIILYSLGVTEWGPTENTLGVESTARPFAGMRVVQVVEITAAEDEAPEEDPEPVLEIEPEPEVQTLGPEVVAGPADEGLEEERDRRGVVRAAEVLRVRSSDHRLWRAALPELFELTEAERLQLELAGLLEAWHDSVAIALASESALTDWTMTDEDGNRWGVSQGKLHLGSLTLPLPVQFGGTTWQRERASRRAWEDADILNNLNSQAARASWGERAKAIRERKDRQRREAEAQPDTARSSGGRPPR
jgi:hypothetical protein